MATTAQAAPRGLAGLVSLGCACCALLLHGCGGGGGGGGTTTSTTTTTTTTTTTLPQPEKEVLRGIAYGALPCSPLNPCKVKPPEDETQAGYEMQWGPKGRDDLGQMRRLGANTVRLYHSLGDEGTHDHAGFLDRAQELSLDVMAGFHTYMPCPQNDCYESWKAAATAGFKVGFKKDGKWHPAISTLILLNEPDFTPCPDNKAWCRVKKALSSLEGVLAAEEEAGVSAGRELFTITWSFAIFTSLDGKVKGPGIFGFQDMVAGVANPSLAQYTPRGPVKRLQDAFAKRWVHSLNTQSPWSFVKEQVESVYHQFLPHRWFIGEYGANGQTNTTIISDLQDMEEHAKTHNESFWGATFFQFQTAYEKGGSELNFGMYSLGNESIGETGEVCSGSTCNTKYKVYCLNTNLPWFEKTPPLSHRAEAVAAAWNGSAEGGGRCKPSARPSAPLAEELVV